jgi:hypothetical protein
MVRMYEVALSREPHKVHVDMWRRPRFFRPHVRDSEVEFPAPGRSSPKFLGRRQRQRQRQRQKRLRFIDSQSRALKHPVEPHRFVV